MKIKRPKLACEKFTDGAWYYQFNFELTDSRPNRFKLENWQDIIGDVTDLLVPVFCPEEIFSARFVDNPRIFGFSLQLLTTARITPIVLDLVLSRLDNARVDAF